MAKKLNFPFLLRVKCLLIPVFFFGCSENKTESKPENLVSKNQMVDSTNQESDSLATRSVEQEEEKEIYFEGTIVDEIMFEYAHNIQVKISEGKLAGKTESFVFQGDMNDPLVEKYTGNFKCNGDGSVVGKKISGKVIKSKYSYENVEDGSMISKDCYRPIELNKK